jgi:hypothetical protein
VEFPPDPDGQLLRFGPGQQVAEVERVEILLLADPAAFLDQFAVHQRDLSRRPAKAEAADARRNAHQFAKIGMSGSRH